MSGAMGCAIKSILRERFQIDLCVAFGCGEFFNGSAWSDEVSFVFKSCCDHLGHKSKELFLLEGLLFLFCTTGYYITCLLAFCTSLSWLAC